MEKKEITILDLVKIAARWFWVLLLGAVLCAGIAYFYSEKMVTPVYSSRSKFVIQTKGQDASSDVLESQRTVAYAQLVVGTYIDIANTRNFAEELAFYMNGNHREMTYSDEGLKSVINTYIRHGLIADGGMVDGGRLDRIIDELADSGFIDASYKDVPVADAVESLIMNENVTSTLTDEEIGKKVQEYLLDEKWIPDYILDGKEIFVGDTDEKIEKLKALGLGEGIPYGGEGREYRAGYIKSLISFSSAEESTTFTITVTSSDANEAYTIAKLCEIIMADYIEEIYPGTGFVTPIDSAVKPGTAPTPINKNTTLLTLVGFVAGLVLAFVIVYIIELADNRIKNQDELAEKTGLSIMGIIPDTQLEKKNSGAYSYGYGYKKRSDK